MLQLLVAATAVCLTAGGSECSEGETSCVEAYTVGNFMLQHQTVRSKMTEGEEGDKDSSSIVADACPAGCNFLKWNQPGKDTSKCETACGPNAFCDPENTLGKSYARADGCQTCPKGTYPPYMKGPAFGGYGCQMGQPPAPAAATSPAPPEPTESAPPTKLAPPAEAAPSVAPTEVAPAAPAAAYATEMQEGMQAVLDRHNVYRCMHGVPQMTWNDEVAVNAAAWAKANDGVMEHGPAALKQNVGGFASVGENLAWADPKWADTFPLESVDNWYGEIHHPMVKNGQIGYFLSGTGHYTAIVWKASTSLGCGSFKTLLVCQYGPGGNGGGDEAYAENVLAGPTKPEAECGGRTGCVQNYQVPACGRCDEDSQCACVEGKVWPERGSFFCCPRNHMCRCGEGCSAITGEALPTCFPDQAP